MVHLLLIDVKIPANAQVFFAGLMNFVTFDILEFLTPTIQDALNLYDTVEVDDNFANLGYGSNYFILNMGTLFLVMVYFVLLLIFYAATVNVTNPRFVKIRAKLTTGLIWNNVICFLTESFMVLALCTTMNLANSFHFKSVGTVISSNLTMLGFLLCVGFPVFAAVFLWKKRDRLQEEKYK